jgi:hypothetical protein
MMNYFGFPEKKFTVKCIEDLLVKEFIRMTFFPQLKDLPAKRL